jgi:hypothetical protein
MGSSNDILVTSHAVLDDEIVNADVKSTAAIVESKLAFDIVAGHDHDGVDSKYVWKFDGDLTKIANLDYSPDSKVAQFTGSVVVGEEPSYFKTVYLKADGTIALTDKLNMTKMPAIGLVVRDLGTNNWLVLLQGIWRDDAIPGPPAPGLFLYVGASGGLDTSRPEYAGNVIQAIAICLAANYIYINPGVPIEIAGDLSLSNGHYSSDSKSVILTGSVVVGEEPIVGRYVYIKADGTIALADATDATKMPVLGRVVVEISTNLWDVLIEGIIRDDGVAGAINTEYYLAAGVGGNPTNVQPAVVGNIVQKIAKVVQTNYLLIYPDTSTFAVE